MEINIIIQICQPWFLIIANGNNQEPRLYFNYNIELSRELTAQSYHDDFEFETITPVGEQGITITI